MKYWNGSTWIHIDDHVGIDIPTGVSVIVCKHFVGTGKLDPSIHVITNDESQGAVEDAHDRYRGYDVDDAQDDAGDD